ncbi:MAG TPA: alpha/beta fold hydrolase [Ferrovibrio sp.]|uniref:alpha/beta hydrolase family protein n=1 Tax=Ferrovibrio sp. TaxID=1917215 RepID=UPI002B4B2CB4|nr:alpha/beta fold hydrolase [Ferrovibrio sp.]HLT78119.1 alpha/beta fold hydrolase [Ferrovibrio sp.]
MQALFALMLLAGIGGNGHAAEEQIINQQVSFTSSDGTTLAGTLTLPVNITAGVPGVLLLQGSGPTDRDGNQLPLRTDLLRQIAEELTSQGMATLRFDKRGMHANAAGRPAAQSDYAAFFGWDRFIADAFAAYTFLKDQDVVDDHRIALLGHSEGGLIALDLASRLKADEAPAALVLAATPGRPLNDVLRDQLERLLGEQRATPAQRRFFLAANDRISKTIRETGKVPNDVPPGLAALYPFYIGPFWQAVMQLDPATLAGNVTMPVLLLQGDSDQQISPEKDALALSRALERRSAGDHALLMLTRTSHNLKPLQNNSDPGIEGDVDPGLLRRLSEWLLEKLNR